MKKIIVGIAMALMAVCAAVTGCKTVPSTATVSTTSYALGVVGGYACELSKTKTSVREGILTVLNVAVEVTPSTNETFVAAWTPVIDKEVAKLVEAGKISETEGVLVKNALTIASSSIDFMFTRHPTWKEYQELVSAAVTGFVAGFESVVKPTDSVPTAAIKDAVETDDIKAYQLYLKTAIKQ